MIIKWYFFALLLFVSLAYAGEPEVIKLSPKVMLIDRDWDYFKSVPCARLTEIKVHSPQEQKLLDRRKVACLQHYKAFMSKPVGH